MFLSKLVDNKKKLNKNCTFIHHRLGNVTIRLSVRSLLGIMEFEVKRKPGAGVSNLANRREKTNRLLDYATTFR